MDGWWWVWWVRIFFRLCVGECGWAWPFFGRCGCVWTFFWLHVGKCDLFLAGCGCVRMSVNFFWLHVCGFEWVWHVGCGWVWVSARFITTHEQHIWDKTHNSNENVPYKKDLLTSIKFLSMLLLSSFFGETLSARV